MLLFAVKRPTDTVTVTILPHKKDGTYSFVNLTKRHICSCKFNTVKDAIADMDKLKKEGKVLSYKQVNCNEVFITPSLMASLPRDN